MSIEEGAGKQQESVYVLPLSFSSLTLHVRRVGEDVLLCLQGGEKPHIGCVVLAEPRSSLTGDGSVSATSSVINRTGHKDEAICRVLAEKVCKEFNAVTVCTGGFHVDHLTAEQIREVERAVADFEP